MEIDYKELKRKTFVRIVTDYKQRNMGIRVELQRFFKLEIYSCCEVWEREIEDLLDW